MFGSYVRITLQKSRKNYVRKLRKKTRQMESKSYVVVTFESYVRVTLQKSR